MRALTLVDAPDVTAAGTTGDLPATSTSATRRRHHCHLRQADYRLLGWPKS